MRPEQSYLVNKSWRSDVWWRIFMPKLLRSCQLKKKEENRTMKPFSMKYHLFSTYFYKIIKIKHQLKDLYTSKSCRLMTVNASVSLASVFSHLYYIVHFGFKHEKTFSFRWITVCLQCVYLLWAAKTFLIPSWNLSGMWFSSQAQKTYRMSFTEMICTPTQSSRRGHADGVLMKR